MPNFFKSFFSGKSETPESEKQKNDQKNFEIFKYDGLRAQRMGRPDYAVKCFIEALAIKEEFETMGYLSQLYIQMGETAKARELLEKMAAMEPDVTSTFLTLANVCFIQEDYQAMEEAANKAIAIEEGNAVAHYLLGKARKGQDDDLMTIAHLTKAITLKDDFIEARLLRAEALMNLKQYKDDGRYRCCARPESGRRDSHAPARKSERSRRQGRRGRRRLQTGDGNKPVQRTGIPLFRATLYQPEKTDGSHRPV